ncbi:MAG: hypothetical protein ACOYOH_28780, partial [Paracraurococcus sp.]
GRCTSPDKACGVGVEQLREEWMWRWIARENAKGGRIGDAVVAVAQAVGRSTKAVEKWREAWIERKGEDWVKGELEAEGSGKADLRWRRHALTLEDLAKSKCSRGWRCAA